MTIRDPEELALMNGKLCSEDMNKIDLLIENLKLISTKGELSEDTLRLVSNCHDELGILKDGFTTRIIRALKQSIKIS